MPNRILRDGVLTSERVNALSFEAELFYRRLMSVADDFGRYPANPTLLRSAVYPLKPDHYNENQIDGLLRECADAGLLTVYRVDGRLYLELLDFRQRTRAMKSKWPSRDGQMTVTCQAGDRPTQDSRGHVRTETETETETYTYTETQARIVREPQTKETDEADRSYLDDYRDAFFKAYGVEAEPDECPVRVATRVGDDNDPMITVSIEWNEWILGTMPFRKPSTWGIVHFTSQSDIDRLNAWHLAGPKDPKVGPSWTT